MKALRKIPLAEGWWTRWSLCLLAAAAIACQRRAADKASDATTRVTPLRLQFAGCAVVHRGPVCELQGDVDLSLWLEGAHDLIAEIDGARTPFARVAVVHGGRRYELRVNRGARALVVRDARTGARATLSFSTGASDDVLAEATRLKKQGEYAAARALLERDPAALAQPGERRSALLARLLLAEGRHEAAAQALRRSMAAANDAGRVSDAVNDATALSYVLAINLQDYEGARATLELASKMASDDPGARAIIPHYEGILALQVGNVREALRHAREAIERTARLGLSAHELLARESETTALATLGRHREALEAQLRIVRGAATEDPCRSVDTREQLVWLGILARVDNRHPLWRELNAANDETAGYLERCNDAWRKRNHLVNAALFALQSNDIEAATAASRALSRLAGGQDTALLTWEHELAGRLALNEGRFNAGVQSFARALRLSQSAGLWDNEYGAQLGLG